ncbi:MAG TPA: hypothetical protein VHH36_07295, partial [Candidatus Thermoplasmatota archaeon]|nr:hypothetical protein [Candidatus Thermoplasmatota archaeon]
MTSQGGLRVALVAFVLLAAGSTASAEWWTQGSFEPDTPQDRDGGAWTDPDRSPGRWRVYFNGLAGTSHGIGGGATVTGVSVGQGYLNPNAAPTGGRIAPLGPAGAIAYLGAWKDCDRDGYVGTAASALAEYPVELLPDHDVCPPGTPFHDGGTVRELVPVVPSLRWETRVIADPQALVWADFGAPGDPPFRECRVFHAPSGTLRSTGGLVGYADCAAQHGIASTLGDLAPGLAFEDPRRPGESCGSALNVWLRLFGPDPCSGRVGLLQHGSGRPAFTVWDCDAPRTPVRDPTAPEDGTGALDVLSGNTPTQRRDGTMAEVPGVEPTTDAEGSVADGLGHTLSGPGATGSASVAPGCRSGLLETFGRNVDLTLVLERPGLDSEVKRSTDFAFRVNAEDYGFGPVSLWRNVSATVWRQAVGYGAWVATNAPHGPPSYVGPVVREDLSPSGPAWITFYARLGTQTLAVADAPGSGGFYGGDA